MAGRGQRPRYTPTTCFETFPLPWPPGEEPKGDSRIEAIAEAARRLDELRRNWLNPEGASEAELKKRTLTNLYNARPTWLENAHERLDEAVFAAYGWPPDISDEEILKNLLALNLERSERAPPRNWSEDRDGPGPCQLSYVPSRDLRGPPYIRIG